MERIEKPGKLEEIANEVPFLEKAKREFKAYLVDTSAKVGTYVVPMGLMEAYQGLNFKQIVGSRLSVAAADAVLARVYGRSLNFTRNLFGTEGKKGIKSYLVDTTTMLGVYVPAYAGILAAVGADKDKIKGACAFLSVMLAVTARPFSKYILDNWRRYWGTK